MFSFMSCAQGDFVVSFRRRLDHDLNQHWQYIQGKARNITISVQEDTIFWALNKKGVFTIKSMYQHLERNLSGPNNKWIWKSKIPLNLSRGFDKLGFASQTCAISSLGKY
jgi:hypothetical protein